VSESEDIAANPQPSGEFTVDVEKARLHPALAALSCIRTGTWDVPDATMLMPVCLQVEVFTSEDASSRGEPQDGGTVLTEHQAFRAAKDAGQNWLLARHAEIPPGMGTEEYVLRRMLERLDVTVGQRAVLAAKLGRLLTGGPHGSPTPSGEEGKGAQEEALREAARLAAVPLRTVREAEGLLERAPDLAERVLRGELTVHEASAELLTRTAATKGDGAGADAQHLVGELQSMLARVSSAAQLPEEARIRVLEVIEELGRRLRRPPTDTGGAQSDRDVGPDPGDSGAR